MTTTPIQTGQDWTRLKNRVIAARVALGMKTRRQLARTMGISDRVIDDLENCRRTNYDQATLARLEQALGWATGSVDVVLSGGEPFRASVDHTTPDPAGVSDVELMARVVLESDLLPDRVKHQVLLEVLRFQERQAQERRTMLARWSERLRQHGTASSD